MFFDLHMFERIFDVNLEKCRREQKLRKEFTRLSFTFTWDTWGHLSKHLNPTIVISTYYVVHPT